MTFDCMIRYHSAYKNYPAYSVIVEISSTIIITKIKSDPFLNC